MKENNNNETLTDSGAGYYAAYCRGDDSAVELLLDEYRSGLTLSINSYVHDMAAAEDLTQEVFIKLVTKRPRFDRRSTFRVWLYAIGANLAKDYLRRAKRRSSLPLDESREISENDLLESYIKKEEQLELYRGLMMLKEEYRIALWLTYFEDLPVKEVARIMDRSEASVKHLINRGKYALRAELTDKAAERLNKDEK